MNRLERLLRSFARSKPRLVSGIKPAELTRIISKVEEICDELSHIASFASLSYAANTQSEEAAARVASTSRLAARVANEILFFTQWWKLELDERNARRLLAGLGRVRGYFEHMRLTSKHTLPEPQERIINIMDITGSSALVRLYDTITSGFEYRVGSRRMNREKLMPLVRSRQAQTRRAAYSALLSKFRTNRAVLGDIYTNVVSEWDAVEVNLRSHGSAISVRNTTNNIDDRTVSALLDSCQKNMRIFRRFFSTKAEILGQEKLRRYDLYAPISGASRRYSYDDAIRNVLAAMSDFDPRMSKMATRMIEARHIDSSVRHGKRDGAFCSTVSPRLLPYVLLSFTGTSEDMFTLAHELGHAVHSIAASSQSILTQEAPLPVAETASTFSEMLLYDHLIKNTRSNTRRRMLASKIDSLYATIARQSFFTMFEIDAHRLVAGSSNIGEVSDAYIKSLRNQFGKSVDVSDDFADEWVAIPHFYHTPFYCYAYAFGNLMALSLFSRHKAEGRQFADTYLGILAAGGSEKPEDLMLRHGFDIGNRTFWQDGFDYVSEQVRLFERERLK